MQQREGLSIRQPSEEKGDKFRSAFRKARGSGYGIKKQGGLGLWELGGK